MFQRVKLANENNPESILKDPIHKLGGSEPSNNTAPSNTSTRSLNNEEVAHNASASQVYINISSAPPPQPPPQEVKRKTEPNEPKM